MSLATCNCGCHTGIVSHVGPCSCQQSRRPYGVTPYDEILALKAQILEYEHALEHVVDCGSCGDCKRLSQSALDGVNRTDFLELLLDRFN